MMIDRNEPALSVSPASSGRPWPVDRFYARDGTPISISEWARKRRDRGYAILREWEGSTGDYIRTCWTGVEIHFGPCETPAIFETHIRVGTERHIYRYRIELTAYVGHDGAEWFVKRGIKPWDDVAVRAAGGTPSV